MSQSSPVQSNLAQMSDIFMSLPTQEITPLWLIWVEISAAIVFVFIISFIIWKYFKSPLVALERRLKHGKLSSREGAHCLAYLLQVKNNKSNYDTGIQQQIDQLRFQRQVPEINVLLMLIDKVKDEP